MGDDTANMSTDLGFNSEIDAKSARSAARAVVSASCRKNKYHELAELKPRKRVEVMTELVDILQVLGIYGLNQDYRCFLIEQEEEQERA